MAMGADVPCEGGERALRWNEWMRDERRTGMSKSPARTHFLYARRARSDPTHLCTALPESLTGRCRTQTFTAG